MKQITKQSIKAFMDAKAFSKSNMIVEVLPNVTILKLFNNAIAYRYNDPQRTLTITNCNWFTRTTKERLNALEGVNIVQKNFEWYLNGEQWNGEKIDIQSEEAKPKDNLNFMNAFLMLSDLENDNIKDKVKSKQRIVFATMRANIPQWQPPSNWETLTDTEKLKRLEQIQKM